MAVIDSTKKEINFKIVYYGPGRSGKTTSLQQLRNLIESPKKSKVKKTAENEQTIFFDFLALSSESIGGYKTKFQVYTVPGQVLYEDSRKLLLKGVDGIIFVADSQLEKMQDNLQCLEELAVHLQLMGTSILELPLVIQYNKRDLPNGPSLKELQKAINQHHVPDFESVAMSGKGVVEPFKEILRKVLMTMKEF